MLIEDDLTKVYRFTYLGSYTCFLNYFNLQVLIWKYYWLSESRWEQGLSVKELNVSESSHSICFFPNQDRIIKIIKAQWDGWDSWSNSIE